MPRRRPRTDDTNWRFRDNVTYYTDQAKAVPEVAKGIISLPREMFGAVKELVDDMRSHDDPKREDPVDGPSDRPG